MIITASTTFTIVAWQVAFVAFWGAVGAYAGYWVARQMIGAVAAWFPGLFR
jgi:uncharacterized membrane protein